MVAIPTEYNGTRFRSRLEAKWAALFDRCDWRWTYEPQDYDGYIPDFRLQFRVPILVEVKPLRWDESDSDEDILQAARTKIVHSGISGEVLIVGTHIVPDQRLGMLMDINPETDEASPWNWAFGFACEHCGNPSFASECNSWHCRVRGCYDERSGRGHLGDWDIDLDFRRASSEVQWRPR